MVTEVRWWVSNYLSKPQPEAALSKLAQLQKNAKYAQHMFRSPTVTDHLILP